MCTYCLLSTLMYSRFPTRILSLPPLMCCRFLWLYVLSFRPPRCTVASSAQVLSLPSLMFVVVSSAHVPARYSPGPEVINTCPLSPSLLFFFLLFFHSPSFFRPPDDLVFLLPPMLMLPSNPTPANTSAGTRTRHPRDHARVRPAFVPPSSHPAPASFAQRHPPPPPSPSTGSALEGRREQRLNRPRPWLHNSVLAGKKVEDPRRFPSPVTADLASSRPAVVPQDHCRASSTHSSRPTSPSTPSLVPLPDSPATSVPESPLATRPTSPVAVAPVVTVAPIVPASTLVVRSELPIPTASRSTFVLPQATTPSVSELVTVFESLSFGRKGRSLTPPGPSRIPVPVDGWTSTAQVLSRSTSASTASSHTFFDDQSCRVEETGTLATLAPQRPSRFVEHIDSKPASRLPSAAFKEPASSGPQPKTLKSALKGTTAAPAITKGVSFALEENDTREFKPYRGTFAFSKGNWARRTKRKIKRNVSSAVHSLTEAASAKYDRLQYKLHYG